MQSPWQLILKYSSVWESRANANGKWVSIVPETARRLFTFGTSTQARKALYNNKNWKLEQPMWFYNVANGNFIKSGNLCSQILILWGIALTWILMKSRPWELKIVKPPLKSARVSRILRGSRANLFCKKAGVPHNNAPMSHKNSTWPRTDFILKITNAGEPKKHCDFFIQSTQHCAFWNYARFFSIGSTSLYNWF